MIEQVRIVLCAFETLFLGCFGYFSPNRVDVCDFYSLGGVVFECVFELFDDIYVESSTKTGVGGENDDSNAFHFALNSIGRGEFAFERSYKRRHDAMELLLVGKHLFDGLLRVVQFRTGYHFHGTRDLTGAVD